MEMLYVGLRRFKYEKNSSAFNAASVALQFTPAIYHSWETSTKFHIHLRKLSSGGIIFSINRETLREKL